MLTDVGWRFLTSITCFVSICLAVHFSHWKSYVRAIKYHHLFVEPETLVHRGKIRKKLKVKILVSEYKRVSVN